MASSLPIGNSGKYGDLKRRLFFLLGALLVFRVGAHIPVPGIDPARLSELFQSQQGGILGLFNMFSGGALGRKLLTHVRDVMRSGNAVPEVRESTPLAQALMEITRKGMAMTAVVDPDGRAVGVFTDGDLRRLLETSRDWKTVPIGEVMHRNPRTVHQDQLAVEAVQIMETNRINQLLVVDGDGRLVGALHIHDLTRAKVI